MLVLRYRRFKLICGGFGTCARCWGIQSSSIPFVSSVIRRRGDRFPPASLITRQIVITNFRLQFSSRHGGRRQRRSVIYGIVLTFNHLVLRRQSHLAGFSFSLIDSGEKQNGGRLQTPDGAKAAGGAAQPSDPRPAGKPVLHLLA